MKRLAMCMVALVFAGLTKPAPSVAAAAVGQQVVEVVGASVTVREVLPSEIQVNAADDALGAVIISGLRLGERRVLTPAEIVLRLREQGIDAGAHGWAWTRSVVVVRRSQVVSSTQLVAQGEAAIRGELRPQPGDEAVITAVAEPRPLLGPDGEITFTTTLRRPALPGGLWAATVSLGSEGSAIAECVIRYRVRVVGEVMVTRRPVARHEVLDLSNVTAERREIGGLRGEVIRTAEVLAGMRAIRGVGGGTVATTEWIEHTPAVHKGDSLVAVSQVGPVVARSSVTALADGRAGEVIAARVEGDNAKLLVKVSGTGQGEVIVSP